MLARTADSLFWISRYVERAENLARALDVALRMATLPSAYAGTSNEWESAIAAAAVQEEFYKSYDEANARTVTEFIVSSSANPSSIRQCLEIARANARAVRTAITSEVWETLNDGWNEIATVNLGRLSEAELSRFLGFVRQVSLRFDGAAYRTMLRTDHYWFNRLGLYVERSDNMARLLDVKYHLLLPEAERVGGGLDYFQWAALLRAVSGLNSYHVIYREGVRPWLIADFMILRPEQPRSLMSSYENLNRYLDFLAERYGRQGESQRLARITYAGMQNTEIATIFQSGLHEFLERFMDENAALGLAISRQYLQ